MEENDDNAAYEQLCEHVKKRGCSGVIWHQHFGKVFVMCKSSWLAPGKLYSAIYESFYDLVDDDAKIVKQMRLDAKCKSFSQILVKLDLEDVVA